MNKISVLIPCYNEEKSITACINSILKQTRQADQIVVVDDASKDKSVQKIRKFGKKVTLVRLTKNTGNKSYVQKIGLKYIKGDIFVTTDADTILDSRFIERVEAAFEDKKVSAFAGYVKSLKHNWLTACRQIDYVICQSIHKKAQSYIDALYVIPGCAGAFRTKVFKKYIKFDHSTLTEDLDFTYKFHKNELKIVYDPKAIVYTQDPHTLKSYINQIRRWNCGGWQNLLKHKGVVERPQNALEMMLIFGEGLIFSCLLFITPFISASHFLALLAPHLAVAFAFSLYASFKEKRTDLLLNFPSYVFLIYINAFIFIEQFAAEVLLKKRNLVWYHPERRAIA